MQPSAIIRLGPTGELAECTIRVEGNLLGGAFLYVAINERERETPIQIQVDRENALRLVREIAAALVMDGTQGAE
jgi:hypothetical protein